MDISELPVCAGDLEEAEAISTLLEGGAFRLKSLAASPIALEICSLEGFVGCDLCNAPFHIRCETDPPIHTYDGCHRVLARQKSGI